jgi:hypothetical protein
MRRKMAKQKKVNKSQLIRDFLVQNPSASNAQIMEELGKQGQTITAALINQAKKHGGMKTKRRRRSKGRGKADADKAVSVRVSAAGKGQPFPLDRMLLAADFSKACGGIDSAIAALNGLKKIADKL